MLSKRVDYRAVQARLSKFDLVSWLDIKGLVLLVLSIRQHLEFPFVGAHGMLLCKLLGTSFPKFVDTTVAARFISNYVHWAGSGKDCIHSFVHLKPDTNLTSS